MGVRTGEDKGTTEANPVGGVSICTRVCMVTPAPHLSIHLTPHIMCLLMEKSTGGLKNSAVTGQKISNLCLLIIFVKAKHNAAVVIHVYMLSEKFASTEW